MKRTAIDTNILARLLANEECDERRFAEELLASSQIYVSKTVLLETEWILRKVMGLTHSEVNAMMDALTRLPNVQLEDPHDIRRAIHAHGEGMDFADAIHVIGSAAADLFVTFDKSLVKHAKRHFSNLAVELAQ